ncbi:MAG: 4a-hydroxytetrahydrobiopterin dehydratase [Acidimicrobiales bacterium]
MAAEPVLVDHQVVDRLLAEDSTLQQWTRDGDRLRRSFRFDDFGQAFGFMTRVALIAERLFHHPEWSNVYDRVEIAITTHDAGGLTELDLEFARRVNDAAG